MKKVSVILTTYNSADCIAQAINSIQNQQGVGREFELELLVVDDCSTDNTTEVLKKLGIRYLSTERNSGGPNKGRNIGLKAATGDFICIADHDDVWNPNRVVSQLPYMEQVPIVTSGYTLTDRTTGKTTVRARQDGNSHVYFEKNQTFLKKLTKSLSGQNTYLGSIMYRSELKTIFFEEHFGMVDFDWVLRLFHQNASIEVCDSLYNRYVDGSNLSLNESYRSKDFYYSLMFIEKYSKQYPKEVGIAYKKIHGSRARYFYIMNNMSKARFYFLRSEWNLKTAAYYLTTFLGKGVAGFVKKKFNVFG